MEPRIQYAKTKDGVSIACWTLAEAGASLRVVVRTRIYLTDIYRWEEAARAHAEAFAEVKPVASMVEVSRLADPAMLAEIEPSL